MNLYQKEKVIELLNKYINYKIEIHHGDCIGADKDFHNLCEEFKIDKNKNLIIIIHPPNKNELRSFNNGDIVLQSKTYLERNTDIVTNSDIIIGCPQDSSKEILRSGTWSTIRTARKMKKQLFIF